MKKQTLNKTWAVMMLVILVSGIFCASSNAYYYSGTIGIRPDSVVTSVGESFTVDVMVRDVQQLSTFGFCISFNKDVLKAVNVGKGYLWDDPNYLWHAGEIDNTSGVIDFTTGAASSGLAPVGVTVGPEGGVLAHITFQAKAEGTSPIDLVDVKMFDVSGYEIISSYVCGTVKVIPSLEGDVDRNGVVNIFDLTIVGQNFNKSGFDPRADANGDGQVNILDMVIVSSNFGKKL